MNEPKLKLRLKANIMVDGIQHKTGDILEIPERQALGMVGEGQAEQLPDEGGGQHKPKKDR